MLTTITCYHSTNTLFSLYFYIKFSLIHHDVFRFIVPRQLTGSWDETPEAMSAWSLQTRRAHTRRLLPPLSRNRNIKEVGKLKKTEGPKNNKIIRQRRRCHIIIKQVVINNRARVISWNSMLVLYNSLYFKIWTITIIFLLIFRLRLFSSSETNWLGYKH